MSLSLIGRNTLRKQYFSGTTSKRVVNTVVIITIILGVKNKKKTVGNKRSSETFRLGVLLSADADGSPEIKQVDIIVIVP